MKKMMLMYSLLFLFKKQSQQIEENEQSDGQDVLCRFVIDGAGNTIGESVAIQHDLLIVKDKEDFLGVPLKHIEKNGKKLLVKGLVDTTKAKELGKEWQRDSFNIIEDDCED